MTNILILFKKITTSLLVCFAFTLYGQAFLHTPIAGTYGQDFIIVNYVDWGQDTIILDHECGNKSYDGHQGTDFVIRSFAEMDNGVQVLAAADGVVTFIQDGLFDREKVSSIPKGLGNYVAMRHANGFYTYYGHLAKNSISVNVGDVVPAGMAIGRVGSSGNSSDPHLHFELWYDSLVLVDPYQGLCGNTGTQWLDPIPYDTSFHVWTSGLCNFIPYLDTLKEEPLLRDTFTLEDEAIAYWNILYGLRTGDVLQLKWYDPLGGEWFSYDYVATRDWWYFYYWSYIFVPAWTSADPWQVVLRRNGEMVDSRNFIVSDLVTSAIEPESRSKPSIANMPGVWKITDVKPIKKLVLYNALGQMQHASFPEAYSLDVPNNQLAPGVYFLVITQADGSLHTAKIWH